MSLAEGQACPRPLGSDTLRGRGGVPLHRATDVDLNYVLLWFVGAACLLMCYRALCARRNGWVVAALGAAAATGVSFALWPDCGGYVGGGALAVLVVIPLFGYRFLVRLVLQQRYGAAWRLASALRWLHPADGWRELPQILRALASGEPATIAEMATRLGRSRASRTGIGRLGAVLLYRVNNQWAELRGWIETSLTPDELRHDANLIALYLRSFGELGDPNGLLAAHARLGDALESEGLALYRATCRLVALAFCGRKEAIARLFRGPLGLYPEPVQRFWLATADMALGNADAAREALRDILPGSEPLTAAGIERRLAFPLPVAEAALTAESREILSRVEGGLDQEERYGERTSAVGRRAYATLALIALNLLMFAVELASGGSTDVEALLGLGALNPAAVLAGEWWRVAAALFLHFGPLHLALNMLGLLLLGPFLESAVGWGRYLVAYLAAGMGSMLLIVGLAKGGVLQDQIVVGASGSIMGIVGGTVAVFLRGWAMERARIAARRLVALVFVIAFQVVFDLATPQVSFTAHLGGALIGFAAVSLMRHRVSLAPRRGGDAAAQGDAP